MHTHGIVKTKHLYLIVILNGFVAQSVGGYIFQKSGEVIVVRSPKSKASFYFI